jgi:hypothetical protein
MKHLTLLLVSLLSAFQLAAQSGNTAYGFTRIPGSVVTSALGGSQVATYRGDLQQRMDNPAFIDSAMHQSVSMGYLNYLSTINQATLAYGHQFDSIGFGSAYLRYFDYGTFQETDEVGNELGQFKVIDYEIGVTFGRAYNEHFSYGVTLKQVFSNMYQYFGYGMGVDLGAHYHSSSGNFSAGLVARNLGMEIIDPTRSQRDPLPWGVDLAIAKKFDKAPLMFGLQYSDLLKWDLAANDLDAQNNTVEDELTGEVRRPVFTLDNFARHLSGSVAFVPSDRFNLMLGYNFRRRLELATAERPAMVGFSFGANIQLKRFGIQYAITSYHLSGASNHFGITTNLNEWYSRRKAS